MPGRLYNVLSEFKFVPISMGQEEWNKILAASMKDKELWFDKLLTLVHTTEIGYMIEMLVLDLDVERQKRKAAEKELINRSVNIGE